MSNEKKSMLTRWNAQEQQWAIIDNPDDFGSHASILVPQGASISESVELLRGKIISNPTWKKYAGRNSVNLEAVISGKFPEAKIRHREAGCFSEILGSASSFTTLLLATGILTFVINEMLAPSQISIGKLSACFFGNNITQGNNFSITNGSLSILTECLNSSNSNSDLTSKLRTGLLVTVVFTAVLSFMMSIIKRLVVDNEKQEKEAYQLLLQTMKKLPDIQKELKFKEKVIDRLVLIFKLNEILSPEGMVIKYALIQGIDKIGKMKFYQKLNVHLLAMENEIIESAATKVGLAFFRKYWDFVDAGHEPNFVCMKDLLLEICHANIDMGGYKYSDNLRDQGVFIALNLDKKREMFSFLFDSLFEDLKNKENLEHTSASMVPLLENVDANLNSRVFDI